MSNLRIAVVAGSTRPNRVSPSVAKWVVAQSEGRHSAHYELVDLADYRLPLIDEPVPPSQGRYAERHTRDWAGAVARFDGYVFVTPEYNHSTSAALKNALDFVYAEWHDKAAAFVSYGYGGGVRAVEHLRQIASALHLAHVSQQVSLSMMTDFDSHGGFTPAEHHATSLASLFDQLELWSGALRAVRTPGSEAVEVSR